jgi:hypothetical protein
MGYNGMYPPVSSNAWEISDFVEELKFVFEPKIEV